MAPIDSIVADLIFFFEGGGHSMASVGTNSIYESTKGLSWGQFNFWWRPIGSVNVKFIFNGTDVMFDNSNKFSWR